MDEKLSTQQQKHIKTGMAELGWTYIMRRVNGQRVRVYVKGLD